ncbi:MAG: HAD-IA family hydrolase [Bacteriovorax sp.]|nr:HAD-IA family hydrolase [Bacteriovorax sp.]
MSEKVFSRPMGHIVFDHDGTLVNTESSPFYLFQGMRELLIELKSQHFELYVWTARPRRSTLESLKKADILSFFTEIYCSDDGEIKPHPAGLVSLLEGLSKQNILHIGDSLTDIDGARTFGIEVIAACWNDPDQVKKYAPLADYTALNLLECRAHIKRKFHV